MSIRDLKEKDLFAVAGSVLALCRYGNLQQNTLDCCRGVFRAQNGAVPKNIASRTSVERIVY